MKNFMKKFKKNEKGLTLIELLAVIVILGIIAAIAVPTILNLTTNTRKEAVVSAYKNMKEAAHLMITENGFENVDGSIDDSVTTPASGATTTLDDNIVNLTIGTLINKGYMDQKPKKWDNTNASYNNDDMVIRITKSSSGTTYQVLKIGAVSTSTTATDWISINDFDKSDF